MNVDRYSTTPDVKLIILSCFSISVVPASVVINQLCKNAALISYFVIMLGDRYADDKKLSRVNLRGLIMKTRWLDIVLPNS